MSDYGLPAMKWICKRVFLHYSLLHLSDFSCSVLSLNAAIFEIGSYLKLHILR